MCTLWDDKFLEEMSERGYEVHDLFDMMADFFTLYGNHKKRIKRGQIMRLYPSAFDRHGNNG